MTDVLVVHLSIDADSPQFECESLISKQTATWRRRFGYKGLTCTHTATVRIGDENLCGQHAAIVALDSAIYRGTL